MFSKCRKQDITPLSPEALEFLKALEGRDDYAALQLINSARDSLICQDKDGNCALHWVILHEQYELIPSLLEGRVLWTKNKVRNSPLEMAICRGIPVKHIRQLGEGRSQYELRRAAIFCLKTFFDPEDRTGTRQTEQGLDILRNFQELGVVLSNLCINWWTRKRPIHLAAQADSLPLLLLLLEEDERNLNRPDLRMRTCLHYAAIANAKCVMMSLLNHFRKHISINKRDIYGLPAAALALEKDHIQICDKLIAIGATFDVIWTEPLVWLIRRLFEAGKAKQLMYIVDTAKYPEIKICLLLTEVFRSYYRDLSLSDTIELTEKLLKHELINLDTVVRAIDNAGCAFTKKGLRGEKFQPIMQGLSKLEISRADELVKNSDKHRLFFPNYCDRKKIREQKLHFLKRLKKETDSSGKLSAILYTDLKTFARKFIFDAADSRFWGKMFLEIKNTGYDDFEVFGLQDPEAGVRFLENFAPVAGFFLEGVMDVAFSINGVLTDGNLLSLLALVTVVFSLPAAGFVLFSRRWLTTQAVMRGAWIMILLVSLIDISDSLFILSLENDDDVVGIAAAIIPILSPLFVLATTCLCKPTKAVSDVTMIHAACSCFVLIFHGLIAKLRPLALTVELDFLGRNSSGTKDASFEAADDFILVISLLSFSLVGTWLNTLEFGRIILLPETKILALPVTVLMRFLVAIWLCFVVPMFTLFWGFALICTPVDLILLAILFEELKSEGSSFTA